MTHRASVRSGFAAIAALLFAAPIAAQIPTRGLPRPDSARLPIRVEYTPKVSRADTLRGSFTTPGRVWWDVAFYDLHVAIDPADSSIAGYNAITYRVLEPASELQIDLMEPLEVDSMVQAGRAVQFRREGNAFFAELTEPQRAGDRNTITVYYHGRPQVARIRRGRAASRGPRTVSVVRGS